MSLVTVKPGVPRSEDRLLGHCNDCGCRATALRKDLREVPASQDGPMYSPNYWVCKCPTFGCLGELYFNGTQPQVRSQVAPHLKTLAEHWRATRGCDINVLVQLADFAADTLLGPKLEKADGT